MSVVKKVLHVTRGTRAKSNPRDASMDWLLPFQTASIEGRRWERDKITKRDQNFQRLLVGNDKRLKAINAEKERQAAIAKARLKNLAKARRKLKRQRSN